MKPIFVKTKNVKGFINLIHNLKNKPENITKIGLVYGNAGLGKTKTALYLSIQYDAIYVRVTNSMSPKWMLEEIAKDAIHLIHNKAKSFRQIVNSIDILEKVAQVNGLTWIDENIAKEVLCG